MYHIHKKNTNIQTEVCVIFFKSGILLLATTYSTKYLLKNFGKEEIIAP